MPTTTGSALATALAEFQKDLPTVGKDRTADTGKFSYSYTDLATLTHTVLPVLVKHGLSFITYPRMTENGYELVGRLTHVAGDFIEGALPIYGRQPQEIGSALTYARRYLLGSMTGVVAESDDDGARVVKSERTPAKDWDAICDQAEAMSDADEVRTLWRSHGIGSTTPQYVKDRFTTHLATLVGEDTP